MAYGVHVGDVLIYCFILCIVSFVCCMCEFYVLLFCCFGVIDNELTNK